ncbi:hypothetical protein [Salmonella bongori]|uniref:hypothetical protein n=1 Tax=Salmonella bongori TaxID=54736 RepID=UPI00215D797B|nr:hypothetical protein [Salmonella bongori]
MAEMVSVGCKLPNGLQVTLDGKTVILNGAASTALRGLDGAIPEGAFGVTQVEKDFMDKFIAIYHDAAYIQNNAVFIQKDERSVKAQGKDLEKSKTGLEGLDPENPAPGVKKADTK